MYRHDSRGAKCVGPNQHALGQYAWSASLPVQGEGKQHLPDGHGCWEPPAHQAALTLAAGSAPGSPGHLFPQAATPGAAIPASCNTVQLSLPLVLHPARLLAQRSPILPSPARGRGSSMFSPASVPALHPPLSSHGLTFCEREALQMPCMGQVSPLTPACRHLWLLRKQDMALQTTQAFPGNSSQGPD